MMKRISTLLLCLALAGLSSCWKDYETKADGLDAFSVTPTIPNDYLSNVDETLYDLRFTLEIRTAGTSEVVYRRSKTTDLYTVDNKATFAAKLPSRTYDFTIWADFVEQGMTADLYYKTDNEGGLSNISLLSPAAGLTTARSAFCWSAHNIGITGGVKNSPKLASPFTKVRLLHTDAGTVPALAKVSYTGGTLPAVFNALTGEASGAQTVGERTFTPVQGDPYVVVSEYMGSTTYKGAWTVCLDYLFASRSGATQGAQISVYSDAAGTSKLYDKPVSIQLKADTLATVVDSKTIYSSPYYAANKSATVMEVASPAELRSLLATHASLKLNGGITQNESFVLPAYAAAPDRVTLDFRSGIAGTATVSIDGQTNPYKGTIQIYVSGSVKPANVVVTAPGATIRFYKNDGTLIP